MKPGTTSTEPLARNVLSPPASRSALTVSNTACSIWQAMLRFQISSYSLRCSSVSLPWISSGARAAEVGRTASWASWAFLDLVL